MELEKDDIELLTAHHMETEDCPSKDDVNKESHNWDVQEEITMNLKTFDGDLELSDKIAIEIKPISDIDGKEDIDSNPQLSIPVEGNGSDFQLLQKCNKNPSRIENEEFTDMKKCKVFQKGFQLDKQLTRHTESIHARERPQNSCTNGNEFITLQVEVQEDNKTISLKEESEELLETNNPQTGIQLLFQDGNNFDVHLSPCSESTMHEWSDANSAETEENARLCRRKNNMKILQFVQEGSQKDHLLSLKRSTNRKLACLKFGPIVEEDLQEDLVNILNNIWLENIGELTLDACCLIQQVWVPESIIGAIIHLQGLTYLEAVDYFYADHLTAAEHQGIQFPMLEADQTDSSTENENMLPCSSVSAGTLVTNRDEGSEPIKTSKNRKSRKTSLNKDVLGKRISRKLACVVCGKLIVHRIVDHLLKQHSDVAEVAKAFAKTGKARTKAIALLKYKGNFRHNVKLIRKGRTEEIIVAKQSKERNMDEYAPCANCLGFYCKTELARHIKHACCMRASLKKTLDLNKFELEWLANQAAKTHQKFHGLQDRANEKVPKRSFVTNCGKHEKVKGKSLSGINIKEVDTAIEEKPDFTVTEDLQDVDGNLVTETEENCDVLKTSKNPKSKKTLLSNKGVRRRYKKKLACFVCGKLTVYRIVEHLSGQHGDVAEVARALAKTGKARKYAFALLKSKGNFRHNVKLINEGRTEEIIVARTIEGKNMDDYLPCVNCLGFFHKNEIHRHVKYTCFMRAYDEKILDLNKSEIEFLGKTAEQNLDRHQKRAKALNLSMVTKFGSHKKVRGKSLQVGKIKDISQPCKSSKNQVVVKRTNKKLACFVCGKLIDHKIVNHLSSKHSDVPEVARALEKTGNPRKYAIAMLKSKGNFRHNVKLIRKGRKEEIIVARTTEGRNMDDYVPCTHCLGFFYKKEIHRHVKNTCKMRYSGKEILDQNKYELELLANQTAESKSKGLSYETHLDKNFSSDKCSDFMESDAEDSEEEKQESKRIVRKRWSEEENNIFAKYLGDSVKSKKMPNSVTLARAAAKLPGRTLPQIRVRVHNIINGKQYM